MGNKGSVTVIEDHFDAIKPRASSTSEAEVITMDITRVPTADKDLYVNDGTLSESSTITPTIGPLSSNELTWLDDNKKEIRNWADKPEQLADESWQYLSGNYQNSGDWKECLNEETVAELVMLLIRLNTPVVQAEPTDGSEADDESSDRSDEEATETPQNTQLVAPESEKWWKKNELYRRFSEDEYRWWKVGTAIGLLTIITAVLMRRT